MYVALYIYSELAMIVFDTNCERVAKVRMNVIALLRFSLEYAVLFQLVHQLTLS